ncbi:hypothetical protein [Wolbachia endosymbiont (group B) of Camptogramma bilineatum]|uniref:hypothetical protein n=1 Tax=Wolbachia endosymbiont (group B) of Camptogramma bilineatum TaxID=2953991 RepID=UPI00222EDC1E|nr:hypothetical protein [Wolbachia endosymbiont (group B) of Camptogramma bilineatum]
MDQSQERLNVNVNFEGEFAHYLIEMAKVQNRTIEEVVKDLVEEEIEASKLSEEDEVDIKLAKLSLERDARGDEEIRSEDVDWNRILSAKTV